MFVAFAQQRFTAQVSNNGCKTFAFHRIERFQRIIGFFLLYLNTGQTQVDHCFQIVIAGSSQTLSQLGRRFIQFIFINKLLSHFKCSQCTVSIFVVSCKFLSGGQRLRLIGANCAHGIFIRQGSITRGISLMTVPVAPAK
ncbi:hypothetical protein D3C72_1684530 [compost metagenome]